MVSETPPLKLMPDKIRINTETAVKWNNNIFVKLSVGIFIHLPNFILARS